MRNLVLLLARILMSAIFIQLGGGPRVFLVFGDERERLQRLEFIPVRALSPFCKDEFPHAV